MELKTLDEIMTGISAGLTGDPKADIAYLQEQMNSDLFTAHELAILERVATFVNGFETAAELSEYSHKEKLWIENDDGRPLSYLDAYELNGLEKFIEA